MANEDKLQKPSDHVESNAERDQDNGTLSEVIWK